MRHFADGLATAASDRVDDSCALHFEVHSLQPEQSGNQAAKWHSSNSNSGPIIAEVSLRRERTDFAKTSSWPTPCNRKSATPRSRFADTTSPIWAARPSCLAHPAYGTTMRRYLQRGSEICAEIIRRPVDLAAAVSEQREDGLDRYAEAVTLIVAADLAQVELLGRISWRSLSRGETGLWIQSGRIVGRSMRRRLHDGRSVERAGRHGRRLRRRWPRMS